MTEAGGAMFRTVFEYAALGEHHRTGTPEDAATLDWFEDRLREIGAETERQPWSFDRYDATWSLTAAGREIPALPLFYEGIGDVETASPFVAVVEPRGGAGADGFSKAATEAAAPAAIAVVGTRGGRLFAINRAPRPPGGLPTLIVGSASHAALEAGPVRMRMSARIVPGQSANVIGRIGPGPDEHRVLITTPLSGWFRCAGERGTGIAVMLAVAQTLAAEGCSLLVTGNSGHELEDLGARKFVETTPAARAVFHFGASVAAGEELHGDRMKLSSAVAVRAWTPRRDRILRRIFRPLGIKPIAVPEGQALDPSAWVGEARAWCALGRPMVSMAGGFPLFHTPADIPARATTPDLLEASFVAALDTCRVLAHI